MFNFFKKPSKSEIKPCGFRTVNVNDKVDFNEVFSGANKELTRSVELPRHKRPSKFHLNRLRDGF